jgi:hypothetical protein
MIIIPKVETLQEFIVQAITYDNRLFERHKEKKFACRNFNHSVIFNSSA